MPTPAQVPFADSAAVALRIGRYVSQAVRAEPGTIEAILAEQAKVAGRPLPAPGSLQPAAGPVPFSQAVLLVSYAGYSLVRGGASVPEQALRTIADHVGIAQADAAELVPWIVGSARMVPVLEPTAALRSFFDPEAWVKAIARRATLRTELRREKLSVGRIQPSAYEHPLDRAALDAIRSVPGVETALRKLSEMSVEKTLLIENLANRIQVGPNQFPGLYALFCEASEMLGMHRVPQLFLQVGPPNAYTVGIEQPQVVLSYTLRGCAPVTSCSS